MKLAALFAVAALAGPVPGKGVEVMSFYDLTANTLDGTPKSLADYKGKVVVVVNTASECGYTPQYAGLEKLYEAYKDKGRRRARLPVERLRRPGARHGGRDQDVLREEVPRDVPDVREGEDEGRRAVAGLRVPRREGHGEPKWNFHKYVVGKDGQVRAAFPSAVKPESTELKSAIEAALKP